MTGTLIENITNQIFSQLEGCLRSQVTEDEFFQYLNSTDHLDAFFVQLDDQKKEESFKRIIEFLSNQAITLRDLTFRHDNLVQAYLVSDIEKKTINILQKCSWINFEECKFYLNFPPNSTFFCTFFRCEFMESFHLNLRNLEVEKFINKETNYFVLFQNCTFNKYLLIDGATVDKEFLNTFSYIFKKCKFETLEVTNLQINTQLFDKGNFANNITLGEVTFNSNLNILIDEIDNLNFCDCKFLTKVNITSTQINNLRIEGCKFESSVSAKNIQTGKLEIQQSSFEHFLSLAQSSFTTLLLSETSFQYTVDFSEAEIDEKLTLHSSLFNQSPNFLAVKFTKQALKNIDRETFRIIKHSFQSIGNNIEANKYYAYEMEAYRKELKADREQETCQEKVLLRLKTLISKDNEQGTRRERVLLWLKTLVSKDSEQATRRERVLLWLKTLISKYHEQAIRLEKVLLWFNALISKVSKQGTRRERVLLWFNALISKHGQDYVRASFWLIFCMAITAFVLANDESQWIRTYYDMPNWWVNICNIANGLALGFLPLSGIYECREHLAFFLMLSTIAISTTSWHLLVAIRRHSKR